MFDFIRKETVWRGVDQGHLEKLDRKLTYQLKIAQDLAIFDLLQEKSGLVIAEVGGGDSRILRTLATSNHCFNIEKFGGVGAGPRKEVSIDGVQNIPAFVGEFSPALKDGQFDIAFSISVVEHVETPALAAFHGDLLRIVRPGGIFLHAIDIYIEDEPALYHRERFQVYRNWVTDDRTVEPLGAIHEGPLRFHCDIATNPDNIMHDWGRIAPDLIPLRKRAQLASILVGGKKLA